MTDRDLIPIRRALVSVYDKAGLLELAAVLAEQGVEIVSTGSTAKPASSRRCRTPSHSRSTVAGSRSTRTRPSSSSM